MTLSKLPSFLVLILVACSTGQESNVRADSLKQTKVKKTSRYADLYPSVQENLNKKIITAEGHYYSLTQYLDSTIKITWGNDTIKREYEEPIEYMFAERLIIKWENKDYLILNYNTGSGAWLNLVMPINGREPVQEFSNGLCFDKESNLFVTEEFADTILAVRNLKTEATQFIIERERPCDAASNGACLDTVSISNKILFYKWTTPNKFSDKKNSIEKRVRVTI